MIQASISEQIICEAPKILTPIEAKTIKPGSSITYEVKFEGKPMPKVKWLRNGKELIPNEKITVQTEEYTSELHVTDVDKKSAGKYEIVVSNEAGEAKSSGSVMVSSIADSGQSKAPIFSKLLVPKTIELNETLVLEAEVISFPNSSFTWFFKDTVVHNTPKSRIFAKDNKSILVIDLFEPEHMGSYTCRAENVSGSVTSSTTINMLDSDVNKKHDVPPTFVDNIKSSRVMDGDQLFLQCQVAGKPTPAVKWLHNEQHIDEIPNAITIFQNEIGECSLTIAEVFPEDAGEYKCHATNKMGDAISAAAISVEGTIYIWLCQTTNKQNIVVKKVYV